MADFAGARLGASSNAASSTGAGAGAASGHIASLGLEFEPHGESRGQGKKNGNDTDNDNDEHYRQSAAPSGLPSAASSFLTATASLRRSYVLPSSAAHALADGRTAALMLAASASNSSARERLVKLGASDAGSGAAINATGQLA